MPNMRMDKNPMPEQCPNVRNKNFLEVTTGYTEEMAIDEAQRCLNCKHKPCMQGCPVSVKIPEFIAFVAKGEFENAYKKIKETNALPAVCGRVCPQEKQCESKCVRGIKGESVGIGRLERFVADWHMKNVKEEIEKPVSNGKRVAVVGSGPSGLTVAGDLAKKGYEVTIYEAFHTAGGVLMYGIPEFRLPKDIVQKEISNLKEMGVDIETNVVIGKTLTVDELFDEMNFDAVYIGSGAGLPHFMGIEGESLNGVYSANEFLTRINLMKGYKFPEYDTPVYVGKNVAVLGGEQLGDGVLGAVGVLVLVHHEIAEAVLVGLAHVLVVLQQQVAVQKKVVEIEGVGRAQALLQALVHALGHLAHRVVGVEIARGNEVVFRLGDAVHQLVHGKALRIDVQLSHDVLVQPLQIVRVVNGEVLREAQPLGVGPQHAHAHGMEGAHPHAAGAVGQKRAQALAHLRGGLVGKGDGQDGPGLGGV